MAPTPDSPPLRAAVLEIDKEGIGFAAAHFSILEGGSERIHGHNYRVALRARGSVRGDGTVVDFAALKQAVRAECDLLDHRMLLPGECPDVVITPLGDGHVSVAEGVRRFLFPEDEVCVLPVRNTTCECLAAYLVARVRARLGELPVRLEVTVEESPGQGASVSEG
ncbi:MAG TPA: 6-carboxytetrahydropterin synthase [Candidatus Dormibacteraeota bacterium]|jgi:6-pyruvoyltetrahydropterin/6-carboxytetrahydropterin synthase|nr:6-carboxytetrahydropterin synthase [Candidatus Dormibacteraeota bacterium]